VSKWDRFAFGMWAVITAVMGMMTLFDKHVFETWRFQLATLLPLALILGHFAFSKNP
jgi:hypothetical protein